MLDDMFTCRGGEDLGGGTLDVRCEPGVGRVKSLNATARLLERAMPTAVPASSWRLADGYDSEARRTLILTAFDLRIQAEIWAKKTPPVSGWRSNYAHLTEVNLQPPRHRIVNSAPS